MPARRFFLTLAFAAALLPVLLVASVAQAAPAPGTELWTHTYGTPMFDDFGDAARCPDGGVVAVGIVNYVEAVPGSMDGLICKYSAGGALQWSRAYDNGDGLDDMFLVVAVDPKGAIYVGGSAESPLTGGDYLVVKYDKDGNQKWAMPIDGGHSLDDRFADLVLDASGSPCATGSTNLPSGASQLLTVRLRPADGDVIGRARYNEPAGTKWVEASSLARGDHGSLLVSGYVVNTTSVQRAYAVRMTAKLRTAWARTYSPRGSTETRADAIQGAPDGSSFVLATTRLGPAGDDVLLLKYSASGRLRYAKRYDSGAGAADTARDLAVDASGNVFTTGSAMSVSGVGRAFVIRWSAAGAPRWARFFPTADVAFSEYRDVVPDQTGGVYVAGRVRSALSGDVNGFVRHIRGTGKLAWSRTSLHTPGDDSFDALAFCGKTGICAVGRYLYSPAPEDGDAIIQKLQR